MNPAEPLFIAFFAGIVPFWAFLGGIFAAIFGFCKADGKIMIAGAALILAALLMPVIAKREVAKHHNKVPTIESVCK